MATSHFPSPHQNPQTSGQEPNIKRKGMVDGKTWPNFGARALVLDLNWTLQQLSQSLQIYRSKAQFHLCILNFLFPTFSLICSQGKTFLCSLSLSERGTSSQEGILNNGFPNCNHRYQVQRSKRFSLEIIPQTMPNEHGKRHKNDHGCWL